MKELDLVLHLIANSAFKDAGNSPKQIYKAVEKNNKIEYSLFLKVLEKLSRDGYLERHSTEALYLLTYEGKLFDEAGGYVQQQKDLINQRRLRSLETWLIVGGTALAGIYGLFEMIKFVVSKFSHCN